MTVTLRAVEDADLDRFFEHQCDREAALRVAFTVKDPEDRAAFDDYWVANRSNPAVLVRTIVAGGDVAGSVVAFDYGGERLVGYWLGRAFWGRGIATAALRSFLALIEIRPLHARVAKDNLASLRVLQKCGFAQTGAELGYSYVRGCDVEEVVLRLD